MTPGPRTRDTRAAATPLAQGPSVAVGVAFALAVAAAVALAACSGRRSTPKPVATLASSPQAAAAFDAIREAWEESDRSTNVDLRSALRAKLTRFLIQFPSDGLTPFARIALAMEAMRDGSIPTADAQLALVGDVPPGTAHDLLAVARARRMRYGGDPESALAVLRPLVGKTVDPLVRTLFEEELTVTALATHREYEAISYMDAWLRASSEEEKAETVARVSAAVQRLPKEVLVGALQAMSRQRATLGYGTEIQRILATRLVQIATGSGDAELARTLLEVDPRAFAEAGDAGSALGELVTSRRGLNVVEGRTLGLLLPTASPALRDESADVLRGVLWALGLPRGVRTGPPSGSSTADAGSGEAAAPLAALPPCAPFEPAPPLTAPSADDGVRLVTRDDAGREDRTEASLDELAGEGASIVVAGLDTATAERALEWGQRRGVAVVTLAPPAGVIPSLGFVLGEPQAAVLDALGRAVRSLMTDVVAPIADASQGAWYPPRGGRIQGWTFLPPVSCDIPAARAGEPRFPIDLWQSEKARAWLVSGSPDCATDVIAELTDARERGVVALTLEASATSATLAPAPGLRVVSARAGVVPECDEHDPRADELRQLSRAVGRAGWWTALGRDAATLGRAALLSLPTDLVSGPAGVAERRATAHDRLASSRARLWTTESSGWSLDRTMKRTICALDAQRR